MRNTEYCAKEPDCILFPFFASLAALATRHEPLATRLTPCPPLLEWRKRERRRGPKRRRAAMKCQKCHNPATLHITEVLGEGHFEDLHLCEQCANKYLYDPQQKGGMKG